MIESSLTGLSGCSSSDARPADVAMFLDFLSYLPCPPLHFWGIMIESSLTGLSGCSLSDAGPADVAIFLDFLGYPPCLLLYFWGIMIESSSTGLGVHHWMLGQQMMESSECGPS